MFDDASSSCLNAPIMHLRKNGHSPVLAARIDVLAQKRSRQRSTPSKSENKIIPATQNRDTFLWAVESAEKGSFRGVGDYYRGCS